MTIELIRDKQTQLVIFDAKYRYTKNGNMLECDVSSLESMRTYKKEICFNRSNAADPWEQSVRSAVALFPGTEVARSSGDGDHEALPCRPGKGDEARISALLQERLAEFFD